MPYTKWEYASYMFVQVFNANSYMWGINKRFAVAMGKSPTRGHRILKDLEKHGYVVNYSRGCWKPTPAGNEAYKKVNRIIDSIGKPV
jgi:DNA-binding IclR family transcriptional regulator